MNQNYSAELSQKVTRGMRETRAKGKFTGGTVPYGYKVIDQKLYINDDEAEIVRFIYEQYANGMYVKDIIASLTEKGVMYKGKPFKNNSVHNMLRNKKYSGEYIKDGESFPDVYPRIVSEEIFNLVRQKVDENHFGKHVNDVIYLLKSKIICGYCGQPIHSESGTARDGTVKRYYKCQGRKKRLNNCNKSMIRKEILEEIVVNSTMDTFSDSQLLSDVTDSILVAYKKQIEQNSVLNLLKNDEKETQKALNNLMFALEQGIITATTKQRIQDLENKFEVIKAKIAVESAKDKFVLTKNEIIKFIKNALKKSPQQMIKTIVDRIVLFDDKVDIYYRFTDRKFTHPIGGNDKTENDGFANDSESDKEKIPEGANLRGLSFYKSSYDCVISSH